MLVYHFRDKKFGMESIKDRRLKVATVEGLNDPFELIAPNLQEKSGKFAREF